MDAAETSRAKAQGEPNVSRSTIQLQIMSDLHLETPRWKPMYRDFNITPRCNHLVLLGDIGNAHDERLFHFLVRQLFQFETVFYVLGNHEPWASASDPYDPNATYEVAVSVMEDFETANAMAREKSDQDASSGSGEGRLGRFVFLNRRRFDLSDTVTLLGATLFSRIPEEDQEACSLLVSDFSTVHNWTVDAHNAAHARDLAWLNREIESIERENAAADPAGRPVRSVVVLTHHSPTDSPLANDPEHLQDGSGVQSSFATDLRGEPCWNSSSVKVWAFGHTHFNCDFTEAAEPGRQWKRLVTNQRGYGREDLCSFDPDKVITIA